MHKSRLIVMVVCLLGVLTALVASSSASAAIDPRYTRFSGCPDRPELFSCLRADTPAGSIRMGSQTVPISQPVTLSGGLAPAEPGFNPLFYTSSGGLTGNPQEVPGGLAGLTGLSEIILNLITFGANKVYAQPVLVGEPRIDLDGLRLQLPIRVNLRNPFLLPGCGIGSAANPIVLNLTTGTTAPPAPARPISGHEPTGIVPDPALPGVIIFTDAKHVDNSFSVPGSSGCDLLGFGVISGLINSRVGLPSAAGRNEAIFDRTDTRLVSRGIVYP